MVPSTYGSIYPRQYIAYRAPPNSGSNGPAIKIDGNLNKYFWEEVPWSDDFVDIETEMTPRFQTRCKIRWDDEFLYIGELLESCKNVDQWAWTHFTLTLRSLY